MRKFASLPCNQLIQHQGCYEFSTKFFNILLNIILQVFLGQLVEFQYWSYSEILLEILIFFDYIYTHYKFKKISRKFIEFHLFSSLKKAMESKNIASNNNNPEEP